MTTDFLNWLRNFTATTGRIKTNETLAKAINAASEKPKSFVTISGVGFYEPRRDNFIYDETWTPNSPAKSFPSKLARDWENASQLDAETSAKTRRVIIRSGVVLGGDALLFLITLNQIILGIGSKLGRLHMISVIFVMCSNQILTCLI